jgi:hypothetical protein
MGLLEFCEKELLELCSQSRGAPLCDLCSFVGCGGQGERGTAHGCCLQAGPQGGRANSLFVNFQDIMKVLTGTGWPGEILGGS